MRRGAEVGAPLLIGGRDFCWRADSGGLTVDGPAGTRRGLGLSLAGAHQAENAALAVTALDALAGRGLTVPEPELRRGLAEARWPGRLERVGEVLLDGAHNGNGARALAAHLALLGARWTGDPRSARSQAAGRGDGAAPAARRPLSHHQAAQPASAGPRAAPAARRRGDRRDCDDLAAGLARAHEAGDPILVTGSLYLVGEARALLLGEPVDPVVTAEPVLSGSRKKQGPERSKSIWRRLTRSRRGPWCRPCT